MQYAIEYDCLSGYFALLTSLLFFLLQVEDDGEMFHTLDDGHTRFTDLIQLVEFYQLNKGVLPCKLKHYCARIAL